MSQGKGSPSGFCPRRKELKYVRSGPQTIRKLFTIRPYLLLPSPTSESGNDSKLGAPHEIFPEGVRRRHKKNLNLNEDTLQGEYVSRFEVRDIKEKSRPATSIFQTSVFPPSSGNSLNPVVLLRRFPIFSNKSLKVLSFPQSHNPSSRPSQNRGTSSEDTPYPELRLRDLIPLDSSIRKSLSRAKKIHFFMINYTSSQVDILCVTPDEHSRKKSPSHMQSAQDENQLKQNIGSKITTEVFEYHDDSSCSMLDNERVPETLTNSHAEKMDKSIRLNISNEDEPLSKYLKRSYISKKRGHQSTKITTEVFEYHDDSSCSMLDNERVPETLTNSHAEGMDKSIRLNISNEDEPLSKYLKRSYISKKRGHQSTNPSLGYSKKLRVTTTKSHETSTSSDTLIQRFSAKRKVPVTKKISNVNYNLRKLSQRKSQVFDYFSSSSDSDYEPPMERSSAKPMTKNIYDASMSSRKSSRRLNDRRIEKSFEKMPAFKNISMRTRKSIFPIKKYYDSSDKSGTSDSDDAVGTFPFEK